MAIRRRTLVLMCCTPVSGHIIPMMAVAKHLIAHGYDVCFISSSGYRQQFEAIGTSFVSVQGYGDFYQRTARDLDVNWPKGQKSLEGPACFNYALIHIFCRSIPSQHDAIQRALKTLRAQHPNRPVLLLTESLNFGALPLKLARAPPEDTCLLRPDGHIVVGLNPILLTSADTAPFGSGALPDRSPAGRARNALASAAQQAQVFAGAQAAWVEALGSVGARARPGEFLLDALYALPDRFVQMCTPSVEYPRSDAPDTLRFAGGYPTAVVSPEMTSCWKTPSWWDRVIATTRSGASPCKKKKIVFVCQGTIAMDFNQLVIPSLAAFEDRADVLVVIALGRIGLALPADVRVPANCLVEDYIPYDALLPHVDVFVTNGGYGSFQRALQNGTPLVVAGMTEEKPETAARAEWAGVAVNLRTSYPSVGQLRQAVDEVLANERYKTRASEIQAEIATRDPLGVIVENIEELAARKG